MPRTRQDVLDHFVVKKLTELDDDFEFTSNDISLMADNTERLRMIFLSSYDEAGTDPVATMHLLKALNNINQAVYDFRLAEYAQARALAEQRLD